MSNLAVDFASLLEIGPREEQQDRIFHCDWGSHHRFIVIDGMGGTKDGAEAATTLVEVLKTQGEIGAIFQEAHSVFQQWLKDTYSDESIDSLPGAVGTVVDLDLVSKQAQVYHLGDTRLYVNDVSQEGPSCVQKTVDHIDSSGRVQQDFGLETISPQTFTFRFTKDTQLIICSDGLYGAMDKDTAFDFSLFLKLKEPTKIVETLLAERAMDFKDNASAFIIRFVEKEDTVAVNSNNQNIRLVVVGVVSLLLGIGVASGLDYCAESPTNEVGHSDQQENVPMITIEKSGTQEPELESTTNSNGTVSDTPEVNVEQGKPGVQSEADGLENANPDSIGNAN